MLEASKVEATERPEEVRSAQESKKLGGSSKMERCRFSFAAVDDVAVVVRGGSDAMIGRRLGCYGLGRVWKAKRMAVKRRRFDSCGSR